ncbi:hypothetical protein Catovirus_2_214 [Catovirus CTV1]|uniref:Uncharacterized protein n=1 Tax=Catovirus CTV1 TaxID=1977631 RepID=A0A1V0SC27_9VIRU|nr:hypothetical protein Catovirus_2_214 [Catovirus CTV1]
MATINIDEFSELDYGVIENNLSIPMANMNGQNILLSENEILNPFFVELDKKDLDSMEPRDLHKTFKHVFVMCAKNNFINNNSANFIFDKIITKNDYSQIDNFFALLKCSKNMLYNKTHYDQAKFLTSEQLSIFNNHNYNLESIEIVIPIYEMKEHAVLLYNSLYDSQFKLNQLEDVLGLLKHYSISNNSVVIKNLSNMIYEMKESEFWKNSQNCNMNMTDLFSKRGFQYKDIRSANTTNIISANNLLSKEDTVKTVINKLEQSKHSYELTSKNENFTDIAGALQSAIKRTYYATDINQLEFSKDQITDLFSILNSERELYDVFNSLLVSKDYCHTVINNAYVLEKMTPIINKYLPIYKYLFGYAWLSLYTEECIFKTKTTKNNRYVFDIKTASKLPVFPYSSDDLHQNPYVSILVSEKVLNSKNNCLALPMIENYDGYGITNITEFKKRFNIFTCGDPSKNLLDGLDWSRFAVSGSIITACLMNKSPLFNLVARPNESDTNNWLSYFNTYYNDSDIDLMCNEDSVFTFMDQVKNVVTCVKNNFKGNLDIEPVKSMAIIVTGHYITSRIDHIREYTGMNWTVEDIVKNLSSDVMKEYFYRIYCDSKLENNRTLRKNFKSETNILYNEFFKLSSINEMNISLVTYEIDKNMKKNNDGEMCYYLNDYRNDKFPENENLLALKISENIKFKIKGEGMLHNIEIFRVKGNDFFGVVSKFHLGNVRAYYTGNNIYMLPSCITALMTGINIDYKYFAGARDPIDILNKYRMRGFGVILNKKEMEHMQTYITNVPKWNAIFKLPSNRAQFASLLFGNKEINHPMFKPIKPINNADNLRYSYINNMNDLIKYYKTKYNYDQNDSVLNIFKLKTINSNGSVNPYKSWAAKAYYEMINQKN